MLFLCCHHPPTPQAGSETSGGFWKPPEKEKKKGEDPAGQSGWGILERGSKCRELPETDFQGQPLVLPPLGEEILQKHLFVPICATVLLVHGASDTVGLQVGVRIGS